MLGDAYYMGIGIYGSTLKKMNLMRSISFLSFFFVSGPLSFAQSSNPVADACMTNGLNRAMVRDGNTLYLVGRESLPKYAEWPATVWRPWMSRPDS